MKIDSRVLALASILLLVAALITAIRLRPTLAVLNTAEEKSLYEIAQRLAPITKPIGPVRAGDWLDRHSESGQTFAEYSNIDHVRLTEERNVLYVLPLGSFDETQKKVVELSAEFLKLYFVCDVKVLPTQDLSIIPDNARRVHPSWGMRQINSQYVLDEVLPPILPDDAFALIAFSSIDLYPQDDWNFVFGQASLHGRVGVWSLYRNGDPKTEFIRVLLRTLKTATHETGHMFSIRHCTAFDCNMCGSNGQEESDRRPIQVCSECAPKIWLSTGCNPKSRFDGLKEFCERNELKHEADYYRKASAAVSVNRDDEP